MSAPVALRPDLLFGAAAFAELDDNPNAKIKTIEEAQPIFDYLKSVGLTQLDTSRGYPPGGNGEAEEFLGKHGISPGFTIDTKIKSFFPGAHTAERVAASMDASLAALRLPRVRILYLHSPDRATPFEETLGAVDKIYREGKFEKFGLSNYRADEVDEIVAICERRGFVKPSVYQGQYNAVFRAGEKELFPALRKYDIAFFAYSPTAAGLFSGSVTRESANRSGSRWDKDTHLGSIYRNIYFKDGVLEGAAKVHEAATKLGVSGHDVALRWVLYHSILKKEHGDQVILGAANLKQLQSNVDAANAGPLPADLVTLVNETWDAVSQEMQVYHF